MLRSILLSATALLVPAPGGNPAPGGATPGLHHAAPGSIVETRGPDGLFHVSARIGAVDLRLLVDTGATALVLSERDARAAGVAAGGAIGSLTTAGGPVAVRWSRAPRLEIAGTVLHDIEVAVVAGKLDRPLAGHEVLVRLGAVTFAGDRLVISPRPLAPE